MKILRVRGCCLLISIIILFLGFGNYVSAQSSADIQTYCDDEQIWVYIKENHISGVSAQIGNSFDAEVEIKPVDEVEGGYIHTIILFDNSLSISEKNREKMKNVVKELITNHEEKEIYTLATFDENIHELSVADSNYTQLLSQVDEIEFVNQNTYLRNTLYSIFSNDTSDDKYYKRYVILSDGADDNEVGYTYDEIVSLLKGKSYPVFSIGSKYEGNLSALEEMFSISRAADSSYYLLDEMEDGSVIVEDIKQDSPKTMVCITIPEEMKDGSEKNIQLTVKTDNVENVYVTKVVMPFGNVLTEKATVEESDVEENTEADTEKTSEGNSLIFIILAIVMVIIVSIIGVGIVIFIMKQKRSKEKKTEELPKASIEDMKVDDECTVLMQEDDNSDDCTVLLRNAATVMLIPEGNYTKSLKCRCEAQITIGRKTECDICILDDKAVSGIHCTIFYDYSGKLAIRDNNSSNGTYLNDQKLAGEKNIESGDTLEIGKTRYSVQIIEE